MKDNALVRRFDEVVINEPTAEDTFNILKGIKGLYEKHHHVSLPDDVLHAAVDYSVQYMPQRTLPDKAIDLLDMTAGHLAAGSTSEDEVSIKDQIAAANKEKNTAAKAENFEVAAAAKTKIAQLEAQLKTASDEHCTIRRTFDCDSSIKHG